MMQRFVLFLSCALFFATSVFAQEEGYARSPDGTRIFYRTFGKGKPVLIINGGPGMNSEGFAGLAQKLAPGYRAILYDQRGTGRSVLKQLDSTTVHMRAMLDDIEALRHALGYEQWIVLGHSFGGLMASYYTAHFPQQVEGLILSSSGGIDLELLTYFNIEQRLSATDRDSLRYWSGVIARGDTSYQTRLQRTRFMAGAYVVDKKHVPVIAQRLTQVNLRINALIWADLQRIHYDCSEQLKTYTRPVLIIQGKQDVIEARTAEKAGRVMKNSTIVLLDECGHYGWLEQETAYMGAIRTFLKQLGK